MDQMYPAHLSWVWMQGLAHAMTDPAALKTRCAALRYARAKIRPSSTLYQAVNAQLIATARELLVLQSRQSECQTEAHPTQQGDLYGRGR